LCLGYRAFIYRLQYRLDGGGERGEGCHPSDWLCWPHRILFFIVGKLHSGFCAAHIEKTARIGNEPRRNRAKVEEGDVKRMQGEEIQGPF
jgi:hypothetical protein